jgi:hypothetical protein
MRRCPPPAPHTPQTAPLRQWRVHRKCPPLGQPPPPTGRRWPSLQTAPSAPSAPPGSPLHPCAGRRRPGPLGHHRPQRAWWLPRMPVVRRVPGCPTAGARPPRPRHQQGLQQPQRPRQRVRPGLLRCWGGHWQSCRAGPPGARRRRGPSACPSSGRACQWWPPRRQRARRQSPCAHTALRTCSQPGSAPRRSGRRKIATPLPARWAGQAHRRRARGGPAGGCSGGVGVRARAWLRAARGLCVRVGGGGGVRGAAKERRGDSQRQQRGGRAMQARRLRTLPPALLPQARPPCSL